MQHIKRFINEFIARYTVLFFVLIILIIIFAGTIAFYRLEHRSFFNSFYFTAVTMSTIGYGDIAPITHAGKIVAIFYGFMGAPLFIGFTGIVFQSKIQKLLKASIHAYHKEAKEAEELALQMAKVNKRQDKKIEQIENEVQKNIE